MRVAIIAGPYRPVPPGVYGGTERVIYYLIKGLLEAGHEPILLATADSDVACEIIPIADRAINFAKTPADIPAHQKIVEQISENTCKALRKIAKDVDIIHSHGFDLQEFKHYPNLTTLHNAIGFEELPYYQKRRSLYYAAISNDQKCAYPDMQYAGMIYNGEDPEQFPLVLKPEKYLCFLGRIDRDKSPHLAIKLALSLNMKIKLAGKTDFASVDYFEHEIEPYISHPLVEWLGELDEHRRIELISKARCNLHPTNFREPFGLSVIESAYCGTPTLAINRGAMPELIEDGKTGVLVQDYVEGYYRLKECYAMDRNYIAKRARELFNYQKMTTAYIKTYQKIVNGNVAK